MTTSQCTADSRFWMISLTSILAGKVKQKAFCWEAEILQAHLFQVGMPPFWLAVLVNEEGSDALIKIGGLVHDMNHCSELSLQARPQAFPHAFSQFSQGQLLRQGRLPADQNDFAYDLTHGLDNEWTKRRQKYPAKSWRSPQN